MYWKENEFPNQINFFGIFLFFLNHEIWELKTKFKTNKIRSINQQELADEDVSTGAPPILYKYSLIQWWRFKKLWTQ